MARSSCPACGATVDIAACQAPDGSWFHVPLETAEDATSAAPRYMLVGFNPLKAVLVATGALRGLPDHRFDCPGGNAGR